MNPLVRFAVDRKWLLTSFPARIQNLSTNTPVYICELQALVVFEKIEISHLCNAQPTVGSFEPRFLDQGAKMSGGLVTQHAQKQQTFVKSIATVSRNRDSNTALNGHVHASCCRITSSTLVLLVVGVVWKVTRRPPTSTPPWSQK